MKDNIDLINEYLDGILKGQELHSFEQKLSTDTEVAENLNIIRGLREAIVVDKSEVAKEAALKDKLSTFNKKYFKDQAVGQPVRSQTAIARNIVSSKSKSLFPKLAAAATVLLLITGGFYFMNNCGVNTNKFITQNFQESFKGEERSVRGDDKNVSGIVPGDEMASINKSLENEAKKADQLFMDKKYTEARTIYNNLLAKQNDPIAKAIYHGNMLSFDAMKWNCILLEVGLGNVNEAKSQIDVMLGSDIESYYKDMAKELMNDL